MKLLPQPEEPTVHTQELKAPIRIDQEYVQEGLIRLKKRTKRRELEILLLFSFREPSSSFPLGCEPEEKARDVYHRVPSAKFPLAFSPPVG